MVTFCGVQPGNKFLVIKASNKVWYRFLLKKHNTKLIKFFPTQRELKGLEARH